MKKKDILFPLLIATALCLFLEACNTEPESGESAYVESVRPPYGITSTQKPSGEISEVESDMEYERPTPTQQDFLEAEESMENRLQYLRENADAVESVTLSYYKFSTAETVEYMTTDADLIARWVAFFDKVELSYEKYDTSVGADHEIKMCIRGEILSMDRAWNLGVVYFGTNELVRAKITNFYPELKLEYDALVEQMKRA